MKGKTVVITGASDGIGKAAAKKLAQWGARVVMTGRSLEKTKAACAEVIKASGNPQVSFLIADLSSQKEVRELAAKILETCPRIDVLVNNAGAVYDQLQLSVDGIEMQFAVNHLAPFLLTNLLLDRLKQSAPSRVITTSSQAHYTAKDPMTGESGINFSDLFFTKGYKGLKVYAQSKACNVVFTAELARRLEGSGVVAHCFHPGVVRTDIGNKHGGFLYSLGWSLIKPIMVNADKGAETLVFLASDPAPSKVSGKYWTKMKEKWPRRFTQDPEIGKRLWVLSEEMVKVKLN